jgi:hypothetical protein
MADEVVNLEDETPAAIPEAAPEAPPAEAGPAEVDAVEVGGQKYVPVAALIAERAEKKTLKERASVADRAGAGKRADAAVCAVPGRASRADEPAAAAGAGATATRGGRRSLQYAKALDLYKADGNPDIEKAQRLTLCRTSAPPARPPRRCSPTRSRSSSSRASTTSRTR